ncbi:ABC transporter permease [Patescibacteria group bacterium]|nr:ABC transporter permease [Patescibacteria group bacterium]
MNWHRVGAMVLKNQYAFRRDVFRIFDIFWWPAFQLFIWGLFSTYLASASANRVNLVTVLLGGIIIWTFFDRASKDISLALIDELWNKNFINLFSSPLTVSEYLMGVVLISLLKLFISAAFMFLIAGAFYSVHITTFGWYFVPAAVGLTLMGWTMSLIVQACIMRWGHTVEVFIWAIATLVQPFSCVFYPLRALPEWAQTLARALPTTYLFENMRSNMMGQGIILSQLGLSFGLNILYFLVALWFFYRTFAYAKAQGLIIKNY